MIDVLGSEVSYKLFFYIMVSFAFVVGLILMVSHEAFTAFDKALQKEYGLKTRLIPRIENTSFHIIDQWILKHRAIAGLVIAVIAFVLLIANK
ncbi:MAG: hypothetical protein WC676_08550 [Candidatus Omnitrophota bacterium]